MRANPSLVAITSVSMLIAGVASFHFVMTKTFGDFYSHPNPDDRASAARGLYYLIIPFILTAAGTVLTHYVVNVLAYIRKWHFVIVMLAAALLAIASFPLGIIIGIVIAAPCLSNRKRYWGTPSSTG